MQQTFNTNSTIGHVLVHEPLIASTSVSTLNSNVCYTDTPPMSLIKINCSDVEISGYTPIPECIMEREKKGSFYTTVKWTDGTYTTVKASDNDAEGRSPYMAFCAALAKKLYGSNAAVHRTVNRHMEKELKAQKEKKAAEKLAEHKKEEQRLHNLAVKRLQKKYKLEAEAKNMLDENEE